MKRIYSNWILTKSGLVGFKGDYAEDGAVFEDAQGFSAEHAEDQKVPEYKEKTIPITVELSDENYKLIMTRLKGTDQ